jgi:hypothetical protein
MAEVVINVPSGASVAIGLQDAASLTDSLWAVSSTPGAVVLVGKLRYAVGTGGGVALADDEELTAMLAALDQAAALTPALEDLRGVVAGAR